MLNEVQYFYILISFALSLLIHYLVIEVTHKKGIFLDAHDKVQKVHAMPTPRIGGLGIFLSSMFMLNDNIIGGYLILSAIPAFIAGFLEDYSGKISPEQRLAIMCLSPVMTFIMLPLSIMTQWQYFELPIAAGIIISTGFIIALINGVNFTDGQNGLAAGIVLSVLLSIAAISIMVNDASLLYICLVLAAAIIAFLIYNFPNGRIFLGDGGAYFLGFMITVLCIIVIQRHPGEISPVVLPALLIYPLWEVAFSALRKIIYDRISPLKSDDFHLHQLLFRNRAKGKVYLPVLFIMPLQVLVALTVVCFYNNSSALAIIVTSFILLYSTVYIYERQRDIVHKQLAAG